MSSIYSERRKRRCATRLRQSHVFNRRNMRCAFSATPHAPLRRESTGSGLLPHPKPSLIPSPRASRPTCAADLRHSARRAQRAATSRRFINRIDDRVTARRASPLPRALTHFLFADPVRPSACGSLPVLVWEHFLTLPGPKIPGAVTIQDGHSSSVPFPEAAAASFQELLLKPK